MNEPRMVLSAESGSAFNEGIGLILSRWSTLEGVIERGWLGRNPQQNVDKIHFDIFSWFTTISREPLFIDDLEDMLDEALYSFRIVDQDCSFEEVAKKLMIMHEECLDGNFTSIEALRKSIRTPASHVRPGNDGDDDDDDECDDDDDEEDIMNEGGIDSIRVVGLSTTAPNPNSEDMQIDDPNPKPLAEERDGWIIVDRKRGKGKRK